MAKLADIGWHDRVLDPSAGTGNLLHAIVDAEPTAKIYAVEINRALCDVLPSSLLADGEAFCADFLACTTEQLGRFNKVLMNPPFHNGADIAHIKHALHFLERDSVLVAICANGLVSRRSCGPWPRPGRSCLTGHSPTRAPMSGRY